ncbi:Uncharacterised protein [Burkholderia pseudomallei]|nr:Uncharacterised protein [Burkholderia pseudomallei]CAJ9296808.1 Uncharacterised protein [Burkholderia pseudomallei]
MQQIRVVVERGDQRETRVHARGLGVAPRAPRAVAQRRHADRVDARETARRLRARAARAVAARGARAMTVGRARTAGDLVAPARGNEIAERHARGLPPLRAPFARSAQARRRAQQPEPENRAAMRVHAARRGQHRAFRAQADLAQRRHAGVARAGIGELGEERRKRRRAAIEGVGRHVVVAARVDVAHESGLRPRVDLDAQAAYRVGRDRRCCWRGRCC